MSQDHQPPQDISCAAQKLPKNISAVKLTIVKNSVEHFSFKKFRYNDNKL